MRIISLLRGVNVGGRNAISMPDLRKLYEELGFSGVQTYIQSGNVICGSDDEQNLALLENKISEGIRSAFGLNVRTLIRSSAELQKLIENNPFSRQNLPLTELYCTFLSAPSAIPDAFRKRDFSPDSWECLGGEIVLHCPSGYGKTKLNNAFFEKNLQTVATTRNWKTTLEISRLATE